MNQNYMTEFNNSMNEYWEKQNSYNQTPEQLKLLSLSSEEFDKLMRERFPRFFIQRDLGMEESCMYFGFEIGKGWYPLLYELCEKLDVVCQPYGIFLEFTQIKEKFGSGRFYYQTSANPYFEPDESTEERRKTALQIIGDLISEYENKADKICASTGKYYSYKITTGWVSDVCLEAFEELHKSNPERVEKARKSVERKKLVDFIKEKLYALRLENLKTVLEQVESLCQKQ